MKSFCFSSWRLAGIVAALALTIGCKPASPPAPPTGGPPSATSSNTTSVDVAEPVAEPTTEPSAEPAQPEPSTEPTAEPAKPETTPEPTPEPATPEPTPEPAKPDTTTTEPAKPTEVAVAPAAVAGSVSGDWPMWGGDMHRNMINKTTGISIDFEPAEEPAKGKRILWTAKLGSQTYGNPVVAGGKVLVGTNNGAEYRPQHKGDRGVVICFDEKTGGFLWQLTREKLPQGRVNDWPEQGICSTPCVEGDRMWVVTNRCEVMCVDMEGFLDGENDGPYQDEVDKEKEDADIVWVYDMIDQLGVFPHNLATSSPVIFEDMLYLVTSNGVDEAHLEIPAPRSPSFIAMNKTTGELIWENNAPFDKILHGQWSSPAVGVVNGTAQVYMPGGNGWLYAFDAKKGPDENGEPIWKFDMNPKDAKYELGARGTRNEMIATPVFVNNSVILAVGQDPEHGEGVGHLYRIDATKTGDVSPVILEDETNPASVKPNPNSAQIWHYGGVDEDGSVTGKKGNDIFRRTMCTASVVDGLVFIADLSGRVHCVDFETGKRYWEDDVLAAIWGSTMVADGKVFLGDEDGILTIFQAGKEKKQLKQIEFKSSIYSTPTIANGVMFITDRSRLYAISLQ